MKKKIILCLTLVCLAIVLAYTTLTYGTQTIEMQNMFDYLEINENELNLEVQEFENHVNIEEDISSGLGSSGSSGSGSSGSGNSGSSHSENSVKSDKLVIESKADVIIEVIKKVSSRDVSESGLKINIIS